MMRVVDQASRNVPSNCKVIRCSKNNCSVLLKDVPTDRLIIDMDCGDLRIPEESSRCDYLLITSIGTEVWVVPIELKSGSFDGGDVAAQLQGGANFANGLLPSGISVRFLPILAHGPSRKENHERLRSATITFRGHTSRPQKIRCGGQLKQALDPV